MPHAHGQRPPAGVSLGQRDHILGRHQPVGLGRQRRRRHHDDREPRGNGVTQRAGEHAVVAGCVVETLRQLVTRAAKARAATCGQHDDGGASLRHVSSFLTPGQRRSAPYAALKHADCSCA